MNDSLAPLSAVSLNQEFTRLKARNRLDDHIGLRLRRAISWVTKAENCLEENDIDLALILYWIAFNSLYSRVSNVYTKEQRGFHGFFVELLVYDKDKKIYDIMWDQFTDQVKAIVEDRYLFQPYWDQLTRPDSAENHWRRLLDKSYQLTLLALGQSDTPRLLSILFQRLYTLRNQLMHGSATYQGSINRAQVRHGGTILSYIVPQFIELVLDNPEIDLGEPNYPKILP